MVAGPVMRYLASGWTATPGAHTVDVLESPPFQVLPLHNDLQTAFGSGGVWIRAGWKSPELYGTRLLQRDEYHCRPDRPAARLDDVHGRCVGSLVLI